MTHADALMPAWSEYWGSAGADAPCPVKCPGELELVGADLRNDDVHYQHFQCTTCGKFVTCVDGEPHHWNHELTEDEVVAAGFRSPPPVER